MRNLPTSDDSEDKYSGAISAKVSVSWPESSAVDLTQLSQLEHRSLTVSGRDSASEWPQFMTP